MNEEDERWLISQSIYEASGKSTSAEFYEADTPKTQTEIELAAAQARFAELEAALQKIQRWATQGDVNVQPLLTPILEITRAVLTGKE